MEDFEVNTLLEKMTIPCPFCEKPIEILHEEPSYAASTSHAAGRTKTSYSYKPPRSKAISDCPHCGKPKSEIQRVMDGGAVKPPSREDVLKKMQELGLPTKISSKKE